MLDTVMNGPDFAAESVDITPELGCRWLATPGAVVTLRPGTTIR
jgi:hypothetical protein